MIQSKYTDSLFAHVRPSHPGGHLHSNPVGTSWHVPPLAQGLETQACSADGGRGGCGYTMKSKMLLRLRAENLHIFLFLQIQIIGQNFQYILNGVSL